MSIFTELLLKINEISNVITKNFDKELKVAFECLDKFDEEFQNGKSSKRENALKDKSILTTLQSIDEDEVESNRTPEEKQKRKSIIKTDNANIQGNIQDNEKQRASKKRSKEDVDGMSSPEQEKRPKRNASTKAQSIISKQDKPTNAVLTENIIEITTPERTVNVNLMQKLRREDSMNKNQSRSKRKDKDEEKENTDPIPLVPGNIKVKQEKVSLPPEPMDLESLPLNIEVKQEIDKDGIAMPPPTAPVPKARRALQKDKRDESIDEDGSKRRSTRTRRQKTEAEIDTTVPSATVASARSTRASSRASRLTESDEIPKDQLKRTRGRKKVSETSVETDKDSQGTQDSGIGSPADKPRPKRTRKAQKAAEKEAEPSQTEITSPKDLRASQTDIHSPILQIKTKTKANTTAKVRDGVKKEENQEGNREGIDTDKEVKDNVDGNEVNGEVKENYLNATVTISHDLDKTVDLPNGVYNHAPVTPKNVRNMNETVVIEASDRETFVLDTQKKNLMDATVVLERLPQASNITDDNSLLTDDDDFVDDDAHTPPKPPPNTQTGSAVKEKVQQFEQMASRVTRNKTRALTKKGENYTPPDKESKLALSSDTLTKMNRMIFNGKTTQVSSSATKPRSYIPVTKPQPASTSKLSAISKAKEAAEEFQKSEKEDARRKKEAILEAKREMQRKKREEKMAAAAAVREAAEKERQAAMEAAARERMEKQAHADQGKLERLKETERKKQELARKAAETEERRRAEEQARAQRLADEMRKTEAARRKQMQEAEVMKKDAAIIKDIEKKQKEYFEKQKMKLKLEGNKSTPLKSNRQYPMEPVYMCDGFQYLNSDSDEEESALPQPSWCSYKVRRSALKVQKKCSTSKVDKLFSVRGHCPDLKEIFPNIERARLKRTSSAVWRTPTKPEPRFKT